MEPLRKKTHFGPACCLFLLFTFSAFFAGESASQSPGPAVPAGSPSVLNPRTGEIYPPAPGGVINPRTGEIYPQVPGGALNPRTGEIYPKTGNAYTGPGPGPQAAPTPSSPPQPSPSPLPSSQAPWGVGK